MRKRLPAAFLLLAVLPALTATALAAPRYVVDEVAISLRSAPRPDAQVLRLLYSGERVEQVAVDPRSGYARVRLPGEGIEGWVLARYLIDRTPTRHQLEDAQHELGRARQRVRKLEEENQRLRVELANAWRGANGGKPPVLDTQAEKNAAADGAAQGADPGDGSPERTGGATEADAAEAEDAAVEEVATAVDLRPLAQGMASEAALSELEARMQRARWIQLALAGLVLLLLATLIMTVRRHRQRLRDKQWRELP